jgi:soluble lytic murein transglycosylase-like protein
MMDSPKSMMQEASGAAAAQTRVRQLQALKAIIAAKAKERNQPLTAETFKAILQEQLTEAAKRRQQALQEATSASQAPVPFNANSTTKAGVGNAIAPFPFASTGYTPRPSTDITYALPNPDKRAMWNPTISSLGQKYNLDPLLIHAVINQESGYQPKAVSKSGAVGMMQLMPATAKNLGVTNPYDPLQNMEGGIKYLKVQLERFGGNVALALAAYNAGPNAVSKFGGIPPYQETQHYVRNILTSYLKAKLSK